MVDTSVVVDALVSSPPNDALIARLEADGDLHAPHLVDIEFLHALRRLVRLGQIDEARADGARTDFDLLAIARYPHARLSDRIWSLRHVMSAYDAAFVSLAEALDVPLITADARLARIPGLDARIELFASGS